MWAGVPSEFFKQILLCQPWIAPQRARDKKLALALRAGRHRWNLVRVFEDDEGTICHDGEQCATLWESAPLNGPVRQSELSEAVSFTGSHPGCDELLGQCNRASRKAAVQNREDLPPLRTRRML
jgi:hypothetical protein